MNPSVIAKVLADRLIKGIIVSGFENDADCAQVVENQRGGIEGTIRRMLEEATHEEIRCFTAEMKTSAGSDYFVTVRCGDRELTPHMFKIKGRADFEVAEWRWLFEGGEKPFVLDYDCDPSEKLLIEPKVSVEGSPLLEWAVDQWKQQVKNRPIVNVHRRGMDNVWRQVIRWAGGDPDELIGKPTDPPSILESNPSDDSNWPSNMFKNAAKYGKNGGEVK